MSEQKYFLIKQLALETGVSIDTIRFYEKKKLIQPSFRADNNYRYYGEETFKRLIFIKRCRALDMSLNEIENLIKLEQNPAESCQMVNQLIDQHIVQVSEKIKELQNFKKQLKQLRSSCNETSRIDNCQILKQLENGKP
ncbi:Cd(II)/Pb(II)-responsive transcriptional regulator [Acinetobacter sp. ANC 5054]|uniref:Cd(II)/Pb(II)-responsive transcriptional regulator n=1 Tax=Acinetobacter sp. ANC 5054 TaxID=1977877 RepID=UPI000A32E0F4|nr:Cd(II)/Pb(II)-responsive transcriptional regulator [Acinetobacter sp. ANC 5054]OTG82112.1 Cd(II)/Pb(II)-responsive transcriptional regulator [Acinetobacter sp. ANC 5054]